MSNEQGANSKKEKVQQEPGLRGPEVVKMLFPDVDGANSAEQKPSSSTDGAPRRASVKNAGKSNEETLPPDVIGGNSAEQKPGTKVGASVKNVGAPSQQALPLGVDGVNSAEQKPGTKDVASVNNAGKSKDEALPPSVEDANSAEPKPSSTTDGAPDSAPAENEGKSSEEIAAQKAAEKKKKEQVSVLLGGMCEHFRLKRKIYNLAHVFYLTIDRCCFYLPLIVMQAAVAISAVILPHEDPMQRYIAGAIAAASAVLMAVQMHFKYSQVAEKFDNFASEYAMLATEIFYENSKGAPSRDKVHLSAFIKRARDTEKRILDVCPAPPEWITNKVEEEDKFQKKEAKQKQEERDKKRAEARRKRQEAV